MMVDDPWAAYEKKPTQTDSTDDPWASYTSKPTVDKKKQEPSLAKDLAYGVESGILGGSANTLRQEGFPNAAAVAAKAAKYVHDAAGLEGYDPTNGASSFGDRVLNIPHSLAQGAPGMAQDVAAGAAGGAVAGPIGALLGFGGSYYLRNAGEAKDRVRASDGKAPDEPLSPTEQARAATGLIGDTLLGKYAVGKTLAPGAVKEVGAKAVPEIIKKAGKTVAIDAGVGAAQTAADNAVLDKRFSAEDTALGGLTGAAAGSIVGGARAIPEVGSAMALRSLAGIDPKYLAAAANETKQQSSRIGSIKEGNAGAILDESRKATSARRAVDASGGMTKGPDIVQEAINSSGDPALPYKYAEMMDDLKRGQPVNQEHLSDLEGALGGQHPNIDQWLEGIRKESVLNQVAQLGHREGSSISGGLHSTTPGRTIDNLARRYGLGTIAGSLALDLAGHGMMGGWGAKIGAGAVGLSGAMRGLDKLTGFSNPVGRFVDRFADQSGPNLPPSSTPVPVDPSLAKAEARQAEMAARAQARADAAASRVKAKEDKARNKDFLEKVNAIPDKFIPQSQRFGRDMVEPASLPENPQYGGSSPVDPKDLAFNALLAKKFGVKDLNLINQFDNQGALIDPSQIPANDPMRAKIARWLEVAHDAQRENAYTRQEFDNEKAMEGLGIYTNSMPTPDAPRNPYAPRDEVVGSVSPMEPFDSPSLSQIDNFKRKAAPPDAPAAPEPTGSMAQLMSKGSAKGSAKKVPMEEAMSPPRIEASVSPMESALRVVDPAKYQTPTEHGAVVHAESDTWKTEDARATATQKYVETRDLSMKALISKNILSPGGRQTMKDNMVKWGSELINENNATDALRYIDEEILPNFPRHDAERIRDHFENYIPYKTVNGKKTALTTFLGTWKHKTKDAAVKAREDNQRLNKEQAERKKSK
jgi:hypothetical protein